MIFSKKIKRNFDFGLLLNILIICIIGVIAVSSATHAFNGGTKRFLILQIVWIIIGLIALIITIYVDYTSIKAYSRIIYLINLILLLIVVALNKVTNGASSWIGIGTLGGQPSEFMKLSIIILFAKKIEDYEDNINNFKNLAEFFILSIIPLGLIIIQPDLGTAAVIFVIIFGMIFMSGIKLKTIFITIFSIIVASVGIWYFPIDILQPHWRQRIYTFFNPSANSADALYHITHSMIAVGSGEIFGMGFGKGVQNNGGYLPEAYSDFIFSAFCEDFGFIGASILLVLYFVLLFKLLKLSKVSKDKFGNIIIIGILFMFTFQIFQNIGMTIGLMPITGITLPFVSYGGSSMLTSMVSIGLVLNITIRRHKINF